MSKFAINNVLYLLLIILINAVVLVFIFSNQSRNNDDVKEVLGVESTSNPLKYNSLVNDINSYPKINDLFEEGCIVINEYNNETLSLDYPNEDSITPHCKAKLKFEQINNEIKFYGISTVNYRERSFLMQKQGAFPTCSLNMHTLGIQIKLDWNNIHINPVLLGEFTDITIEQVLEKSRKLVEEYGGIDTVLTKEIHWKVSAYNNLITNEESLEKISKAFGVKIYRERKFVSQLNPFVDNTESKYIYASPEILSFNDSNKYAKAIVDTKEMLAVPIDEGKQIMEKYFINKFKEDKKDEILLLGLHSSEDIGHEHIYLGTETVNGDTYIHLAEPTENASKLFRDKLNKEDVYQKEDGTMLFRLDTVTTYISRITVVS